MITKDLDRKTLIEKATQSNKLTQYDYRAITLTRKNPHQTKKWPDHL